MTNPIKTLGKAAGYIATHLPVISFPYYVAFETPKEKNKILKTLKMTGHFLYGLVGGSALLLKFPQEIQRSGVHFSGRMNCGE